MTTVEETTTTGASTVSGTQMQAVVMGPVVALVSTLAYMLQ